MRCPYCGFENIPETTKCLVCHRPLFIQIPLTDFYPPRANRNFLKLRLLFLKISLKIIKLLLLSKNKVGQFLKTAGYFLQIFLSIIPGLGQFCKGEKIKALIVFTLWLGSFILAFLTVGGGLCSVFWAMVYSLHTFSISDAFIRKTAVLKIGEVLIINILLLILIYAGYNYIFQRHFFYEARLLIDDRFYPYFQSGDRIIIKKLNFQKDFVHRNDVVVYSIPEVSLPGFRLRMKECFGRVLGLPGDKIIIRKNVIYLNNAPLPADLYPLTPVEDGEQLEVVVPKGCFYIYLSILSIPEIQRTRINISNLAPEVKKEIEYKIRVIPKSQIKGKVALIYYPFSRFLLF